MKNYDCLNLENQLCFPLYVCSKEIVRKYKPFLEKIDLTYTQYIVMIILWEYGKMNLKDLGNKMYLDSGTLTPLLKKLEIKGYIKRNKSCEDERNLMIELTKKGESLKDEAIDIPNKIGGCLNLDNEDTTTLYELLYKILNNIENN